MTKTGRSKPKTGYITAERMAVHIRIKKGMIKMAKGYNHVVLEGNLVRDADVRLTHSKQKAVRFTLAIGADYKKNGEVIKHTDFIDCVAWGSMADIIEKYTAKGRPLLVDGKLQKREYEKDGQKRYITEVVVSNVVLIAYTRDSDGNRRQSETVDDGTTQYDATDADDLPIQMDIIF